MKTLGPAGIEAFERRSISAETAARFAISIDELRAKYRYDPDTGRLIFLSGPCVGKSAGTIDRLGYRRIYLAGHQICSGPVCWALVTGAWPAGEIDHISRDKLDDRWVNLREVTRSENLRNRRYAKSGAKGVYASNGRWRASVREGDETVNLGSFSTVQEASSAYLAHRGGEL